jgi:hypothetical protein
VALGTIVEVGMAVPGVAATGVAVVIVGTWDATLTTVGTLVGVGKSVAVVVVVPGGRSVGVGADERGVTRGSGVRATLGKSSGRLGSLRSVRNLPPSVE